MGWRRKVTFAVLASVLVTTAAATGSPTPTHAHIVVAGDFGQGLGAATVLAAMGGSGADLAMTVGDYSYGTAGQEESWCDFVKQRVGQGFPFELVAGNHESNGANGNINDFSACLPNQLPGLVGTYGRQYYVDVPQQDPLVRFVMISPALTFPGSSTPWQYTAGSARYTWTAAAIDGARSAGIPWVVVGMHKPCISTGIYACDIGTDLTDLLVSKKVDLVLTGHEHQYQRSKQLALGTGCTTLAVGAYDSDCVADADNDLVAGAGTVFVTTGTGGQTLRDVNLSDPELSSFAAWSGNNVQPSLGYSDIDATPDRLLVRFVPATGTFVDTFTLTKGPPPSNASPTAGFTTNPNGLTVSFDASSSTDVDGTITSYAWDFGDGTPVGSGKTPSHTYAGGGAYDVTLTVTDDDGATSSTTSRITVSTTPPVQVIGADAFERTNATAWGTADVGGPWTTGAGASVSGGRGRLAILAAGRAPSAILGNPTTTDLDLQLELSFDKLPAPGGTRIDQALFVRRSTGGTYRVLVHLLSTGQVRTDFARTPTGGSQVAIGSQVLVNGLTYAPGDVLSVRAQAVGTSPTTLRVKVWRKGTTEPAAWTNTVTDTTAAFQAAGSIGLSAYLSSNANNAPVTVTYDAVRAAIASTLP